jgi:anti-sigma factor RsiW
MTHRDDDVDCQKLESLIGDYVDDQLPEKVKGAVDNHMSQCAPCMHFLRQYRFAPEAARKMLLQQVPQQLEDRLLSFLRAKCTGPKKD